MESNRFLIGAAEGCDLRLGGADMPPLHSIVHVDHVEALLETVTLTPPLKVNGLVVESVLLQDGDRIGIGPFEFLAHRPTVVSESSSNKAPSANGVIDIGDDMARQPAVSDLSAAELVDLIEDEERQIEQFEQRRQLGANALMDAVVERVDLAAAEPPKSLVESQNEIGETHEELVRLLEQANTLADELKRRTEQLADREAVQAQLMEAAFESQQQLANRLESLVSRIADLEDRRPSRFPRVA
ncbi:MAG: hypothetical protein HOL01_00730 [Planctomycetaceae bacterium]|nr:hypothetical protein [Planctomycetaceae bacterium]MBT6493049.1 hypothetical protein [Planctomycetaceae bacterium]